MYCVTTFHCQKKEPLHFQMTENLIIVMHANTDLFSFFWFSCTLAVKPDPPKDLKMNKSSGNLHLSWKKAANEIEGSLNEIHIRRLNDSLWHNVRNPQSTLYKNIIYSKTNAEEKDIAACICILIPFYFVIHSKMVLQNVQCIGVLLNCTL